MTSWSSLFGKTTLDGYLDPTAAAGTPYLHLRALIARLIADGWTEWVDKPSGAISAIADTASVWQGAALREVVLGPEAVVGHGSEVISTIVMDRAKINHLNAVGRSLVGPGVSITSHVVIASHRLDREPVKLPPGSFDGVRVLRKFGALIGHHAVIGAHAVVNPGTVILPEAIVPPLVVYPQG